jgi:acetolactate synthase-1/2/3 large subunit
MFEGRELGTAFYKGEQGAGGKRYNPDFAAWARAAGADGVTVTRSDDLHDVVAQAVRNRRPCVIDVHVDAEVRPPSTGTWQLPPTPFKEPVFGKPWVAS